jgi:hypothetical protein
MAKEQKADVELAAIRMARLIKESINRKLQDLKTAGEGTGPRLEAELDAHVANGRSPRTN